MSLGKDIFQFHFWHFSVPSAQLNNANRMTLFSEFSNIIFLSSVKQNQPILYNIPIK